MLFHCLFLLLLGFFSSLTVASIPADWRDIAQRAELQLDSNDLRVYDHFLQIYRVADKGYASTYLLDKGLAESVKSPRLALFHEWLLDLKKFPTLESSELLETCVELRKRLKNSFGISRKLLLQRLFHCRQIAIQQMVPRVLADGGLTPSDIAFLKRFMNTFLYGKNQSDMIWFLQRFDKQEDVKRVLSTLITEHVIKRKREVPRDILSLITISPDLTGHIQNFGLDQQGTHEVFYAEFGRMIEDTYKLIDGKKTELIISKFNQLKNWLSLNLNRLPKETTLGRFSDLGKNLWRNGLETEAKDTFYFVARHGNTEQKEDAFFFTLWMLGSKGKWKEAIAWAESEKLLKNVNAIDDSRLKYWIAHGLKELGRDSEAQRTWENLIIRHPLSFYAILSTKAIQTYYSKSDYGNYYRKISSKAQLDLPTKDIDPSIWEAYKRLRAWARLDAKIFLEAELKGLEKIFIPGILNKVPKNSAEDVQSDAYLLASFLVGKEGNYLESFKVIYYALDNKKLKFNRNLLQVLYPRPYFSDLERAIKDTKLDPLILLSLIRQESVFNPEARSRVGARGLMQLMPLTARRLQRSVREKQLNTPITNLQIGSKYFSQLMKRYDNNLIFVLSAYNAGEARVERWKGLYFVGDEMLPNIESIPFLETRNYVKLIFRNLFFYKLLDEKIDLTDPATFNQIYDVALGFKR